MDGFVTLPSFILPATFGSARSCCFLSIRLQLDFILILSSYRWLSFLAIATMQYIRLFSHITRGRIVISYEPYTATEDVIVSWTRLIQYSQMATSYDIELLLLFYWELTVWHSLSSQWWQSLAPMLPFHPTHISAVAFEFWLPASACCLFVGLIDCVVHILPSLYSTFGFGQRSLRWPLWLCLVDCTSPMLLHFSNHSISFAWFGLSSIYLAVFVQGPVRLYLNCR